MNNEDHPRRDDLIDYVDGDLAPDRASQIGTHMARCPSCASYVSSLRRTYHLLDRDTVPEPPPGFWLYLEQKARERVESRRRRLVLALAPGLAAAILVVALLWRGGWRARPEADPLDYYVAQMSINEMVESTVPPETYSEVLADVVDSDITMLEEYLTSTEDVYDVIDALSEAEREALMNELSNLMDDEETSRAITDLSRREC